NEAIREAAFAEPVLVDGVNSDPIRITEDHVAVVRVVDHQPAEPKPLAEIEPMLREQLHAERAGELARQKAESLLERARAGESLAELARAEGLVFRDESVTY